MSFDAKKKDLLIPESWKYVRVGEIAGINESTLGNGDSLDYIKYIDISSVSTDKIEEPKLMNFKDAPSRAKRVVKKGDIIISTVRPNLKQYFLCNFEIDNHIASTGFCVITPKNDLHRWYLYSYLTSDQFTDYLIRIADGAAYPAFSYKEIRDAVLPLPDNDSLQFIKDFSSSILEKIHLNQQVNKTLEAMAQAIFKSWFVDFDPVRAKMRANAEARDANRAAMAAISGVSLTQPTSAEASEDRDWDETEAALNQKLSRMSETQCQQLHQTAELFPDELVDSELGEVPKGWGVKSLDEIADYLNGKAMQKYPPEDGKDTLPVLKIAQLRKGDTEGSDIATADIPEKFKISDGDMIFSWSGSLLVKLWAGGEAALNQHLFKVTSEEYDQWFYYHWTKFHLDNFIRIAESKAVTMGHIKRSHLKEAKCVIPGNELLEFGKQHIEPLLAQALQQNLESRNLAELRDTFLPKLISGEISIIN